MAPEVQEQRTFRLSRGRLYWTVLGLWDTDQAGLDVRVVYNVLKVVVLDGFGLVLKEWWETGPGLPPIFTTLIWER